MPKGQGRKTVKSVMKKFGAGKLHSGSKKGPKVTSRKQAVAIGLKEGGLSKYSREMKVPTTTLPCWIK